MQKADSNQDQKKALLFVGDISDYVMTSGESLRSFSDIFHAKGSRNDLLFSFRNQKNDSNCEGFTSCHFGIQIHETVVQPRWLWHFNGLDDRLDLLHRGVF